MENALKYASKNGWDIQNTVVVGKIIFVPWNQAKRMTDYLKRYHIKAEIREAGFYTYMSYIFN